MGRVATRNDEQQNASRGRASRVFPHVSGLGDFGLITRRSRVQIPPPLPPENPGTAWVFCIVLAVDAGLNGGL